MTRPSRVTPVLARTAFVPDIVPVPDSTAPDVDLPEGFDVSGDGFGLAGVVVEDPSGVDEEADGAVVAGETDFFTKPKSRVMSLAPSSDRSACDTADPVDESSEPMPLPAPAFVAT